MPWTPPDLLWYVNEAWKKDILQFQQLQMTATIDAKLEVLRKLAIAGGVPRLPALWSLELALEEQKAMLRVLSDLSGLCYHTPIEIDMGSPVLATHGHFFKAGLSIISTVASEALSVPLVKTVIDVAKSGLRKKVDQAQHIHTLFERLDFAPSTDSTTEFDSRSTTSLPPGIAATVLHDLLMVGNDSADALNVSELTNLECVITGEGEYVWAHDHEIAMLGDKVTRRGQPPSVWKDLPEPAPAPASPTAQSTKASPSSTSGTKTSSNPTTLKLSLCVDSVTGLADWDWFKTYCTWRLFYGDRTSTPIASGATTQNLATSASPAWRTLKTAIYAVVSYDMLQECRLVVQVKRRSRIGWTKTIGEGQVSLRDVLADDAKQTLQFDAFQVPLDDATPSTRFVTIQLVSDK